MSVLPNDPGYWAFDAMVFSCLYGAPWHDQFTAPNSAYTTLIHTNHTTTIQEKK